MKADSAVAVKTEPRYAGSGQDVGIHGENISHRHERSDSCHDFSFDIRVVFLQVKKFVEIHINTPFIQYTVCVLKDFVSGNIFSGDASVIQKIDQPFKPLSCR